MKKSTKILAAQLKETLCEEIKEILAENSLQEKGDHEDEFIVGNEAYRIKKVRFDDEGGLNVLLEETWLESDGLIYRNELRLEECSLSVLMRLLNYLDID